MNLKSLLLVAALLSISLSAAAQTTPRAAVATERTDNTVLVDFGQEMYGFVKLHGLRGRGNVAVYYGSAREEALNTAGSTTLDKFSINHSQPTDWLMKEARTLRYAYVVHDLNSNITLDAVSLMYVQAEKNVTHKK